MLSLPACMALVLPFTDGIRIMDGSRITYLRAAKKRENSELGSSWDVIDPAGAKYTDVKQGSLGSCYMVAALVAIAYTDPDAIKSAFLEHNLCPENHPAYMTRWVLNGKIVWVAVDGDIPWNPRTYAPRFTSFNDGADFWPALLEKAWAKIFGSFSKIEGGHMWECFEALTGAPTWHRAHEFAQVDKLWEKMQEATASKFAMGASSIGSEATGIPARHAYAVLKVKEHAKYGRIVKLYNPWSSNRYRGVIKGQSNSVGEFYMTLDEYFTSFRETSISHVRTGYMTTSHPVAIDEDLAVGKSLGNAFLEFTMTSDLPFNVILRWPTNRLVEPCKVNQPNSYDLILAVVKLEEGAFPIIAPQTSENPVVDVPGGAGTYRVYVTAPFSLSTSGQPLMLQSLYVNVYSAENPTFTRLPSPNMQKAFLSMFGWCDEISECNGCNVFRMKTERLLEGMPYYIRSDGRVIHWVHNHGTWAMSKDFDSAKRGNTLTLLTGESNRMSCAYATSSLLSINGTQSIWQPRAPESGPRMGLECAATNPMSQLQGLDNAEEIHRLRSDPLFPPNQKSIGKGLCGDSARGGNATRNCNEYNQWNSIYAMMKLNSDVYTAPECKQFDGRMHGLARSATFTIANDIVTNATANGGKPVQEETFKKPVIKREEETVKKPVIKREVPAPPVPGVTAADFAGRWEGDDHGFYGLAYDETVTELHITEKGKIGERVRICTKPGTRNVEEPSIVQWCGDLRLQDGLMQGSLWDAAEDGTPKDGELFESHKPKGTLHGEIQIRLIMETQVVEYMELTFIQADLKTGRGRQVRSRLTRAKQ